MVDGKELNGKVNCEVFFNMLEEMCKIGLWKMFVKDGLRSKLEYRKGKLGDKYKYKYKYYYRDKNRYNW